jgi:hypothetical protein
MNAPKARSTAIPSPSGGSRPRTVRGVPATTLLWASVVLILGLILVTQRISRPRSNTLPVPPIVAPVDRILFAEADDQVELRLRDGDWVIGEAEYPASGTVADLVEALTALETVDVVSARGRFADYGVGDDEGRRIRVFSGSTEPLAVRLGAAAAAGDGVYGRLNAGREVVLLPRNIDDAFTLEVDQLRETAMVRIEEDEILQVEIAIGIPARFWWCAARVPPTVTVLPGRLNNSPKTPHPPATPGPTTPSTPIRRTFAASSRSSIPSGRRPFSPVLPRAMPSP